MDIEWVIYHLTHNDDEDFTSISDLDIDLCRSDKDQWDRLLIGLSRSRTVTSVGLSRSYRFITADDDDLRQLFGALRRMSRLSKVKLDSFTILDLQHSEPLFFRSGTIAGVWVENGHCHRDDTRNNSDDDDYDYDGDINDNHDPEDLDDDENYIQQYQRFLGYMASMHCLRQLQIQMPIELLQNVPHAHLLGAASTLRSLVLETTRPVFSSYAYAPTNSGTIESENQRRNFAATMLALRSNQVLKKLDMDFEISFSSFKEVATMLRHNNTLSDLFLRLDPFSGIMRVHGLGNNNGNNDLREFHPNFSESIECFFEALKTNTNSALTTFYQYHHKDHNNDEFSPTVRLLMNENGPKIVQKLVQSGLDMLEWNLSLENFTFFLFDVHYWIFDAYFLRRKKSMFLGLNQRGRKSVYRRDTRERVSKASLINQLAKHSIDDLNGLYYYISANPWICRGGQGRPLGSSAPAPGRFKKPSNQQKTFALDNQYEREHEHEHEHEHSPFSGANTGTHIGQCQQQPCGQSSTLLHHQTQQGTFQQHGRFNRLFGPLVQGGGGSLNPSPFPTNTTTQAHVVLAAVGKPSLPLPGFPSPSPITLTPAISGSTSVSPAHQVVNAAERIMLEDLAAIDNDNDNDNGLAKASSTLISALPQITQITNALPVQSSVTDSQGVAILFQHQPKRHKCNAGSATATRSPVTHGLNHLS